MQPSLEDRLASLYVMGSKLDAARKDLREHEAKLIQRELTEDWFAEVMERSKTSSGGVTWSRSSTW